MGFWAPQLGWSSWWRFNKASSHLVLNQSDLGNSGSVQGLLRSPISVLSRFSADYPYYPLDMWVMILLNNYWGDPPRMIERPGTATEELPHRRRPVHMLRSSAWHEFCRLFLHHIKKQIRSRWLYLKVYGRHQTQTHNHISLSFFVHLYIIYTYIYVQRVLCMCDNAGHV